MSSRHKYYIYMVVLAIGCYAMYEFADHLFNSSSSSLNKNEIATVIDQEGSGSPQIGGAFALIDEKGNKRKDTDFKGKYRLVYFGYSFCPDICPTALYNMTQALNDLGDKSRKIQSIFITIDPERDTPSQLALYKKNFHSDIIMLSGSPEQIKKVAQAYRVYYAKAYSAESSADYLVDHSSIIYFMDPAGRYLASFNHETPAEDIIKGISKYLN